MSSKGRVPGEHFGKPRNVIICATEDSWEFTIVPRLIAAGADLERIFRVDVTTSDAYESALSLPRDLEQLEALALEEDVALIVLDPLMSRLDAALDSHKDSEVRRALEPVATLAERAGSAVMGLIHVNKSGSVDPLNAVMGSRAFVAVARSVLFLASDPDDPELRLLGQPKNNLGRSDLPTLAFRIAGVQVSDSDEGPVWSARLTWRESRSESIREVLEANSDTAERRSETSEAAEWLRDYLTARGGSAESTAVRADGQFAGYTKDALRRARERIKATAYGEGFPRKTWWRMPGFTVAPPVGEGDLTDLTDTTGGAVASVTSVASAAPSPRAREGHPRTDVGASKLTWPAEMTRHGNDA